MSERGANWEAFYRALKMSHPDAYWKAIQYAEGIALRFNLEPKAAAENERSHVMLACELMEVEL